MVPVGGQSSVIVQKGPSSVKESYAFLGVRGYSSGIFIERGTFGRAKLRMAKMDAGRAKLQGVICQMTLKWSLLKNLILKGLEGLS